MSKISVFLLSISILLLSCSQSQASLEKDAMDYFMWQVQKDKDPFFSIKDIKTVCSDENYSIIHCVVTSKDGDNEPCEYIYFRSDKEQDVFYEYAHCIDGKKNEYGLNPMEREGKPISDYVDLDNPKDTYAAILTIDGKRKVKKME